MPIRGTDPSSLLHGNATETQSSINGFKNIENDLSTLESNIKDLRTRFEDNIKKLSDIADEQHFVTGTVR
jgi:predicted  nucleic acid-binding Zn-ribbon protein